MIDHRALQTELAAQGIYVAELGRRLGYRGAPSYLSRVISGQIAAPSLDLLLRIAEALTIPPYRLLAEELRQLTIAELRDQLAIDGPERVLRRIAGEETATAVAEERRTLVMPHRGYPLLGRLQWDGSGLPPWNPATLMDELRRVEFVNIPDDEAYVVEHDEPPQASVLGAGLRYVLLSPARAVRPGGIVLAREAGGRAWIRRVHTNETGATVVLTAGEGEPVILRRRDLLHMHAVVITKPVADRQKN